MSTLEKRELTPEEAQKQLESCQLVVVKIPKTGVNTEQDPLPVVDPVMYKAYDLSLGKEYIMPKYMAESIENSYRPIYESVENEMGMVQDYKTQVDVHTIVSMKEVLNYKEYVEKNPQATILFAVPDIRIQELKKIAGSGKKAEKAKSTTSKASSKKEDADSSDDL